jgi:hypothetical protein
MIEHIKRTVGLTAVGFLAFLPSSAFAQDSTERREGINFSRPPGAIANIPQLVTWAIQLLFVVAGLVAFVYLLLGGIKWITSGGDKAAVEGARNQIIQALIGLVVVFAAWGMIVLVETLLDICLGFRCAIDLPGTELLDDNPTFN